MKMPKVSFCVCFVLFLVLGYLMLKLMGKNGRAGPHAAPAAGQVLVAPLWAGSGGHRPLAAATILLTESQGQRPRDQRARPAAT